MEIKLHYLPEKPDYSCNVLVFAVSSTNVNYVANVGYSAKYGLFNFYDYFEVVKEGDEEYQKGIVAWADMDEVNKEVLKHVG